VLGFIVPVLVLLSLAIGYGGSPFDPRNLTLAGNSLTLGALGAGFAVAIALLLAFAHRIAPGRMTGAVTRLAALGYAIPGAVIAVGLLIPLTAFENGVDAWMRASLGLSTGLFLTGTIAALVFAYVVRFLAAALGPVEAALVKVSPSIDDAARTLGSGAGGTLCKIHLPMIRGGLLTAALIVFVDIMKELPATLILRPFNFDTLAVQAHRYAADERLAEAAVPSLLIVAAGLIPILVLSWQIARARIGGRRTPAAPAAATGVAAVETAAPARAGANLILADTPAHAAVAARRRRDKQLAA
jgi:iron(III) transport system permease protein